MSMNVHFEIRSEKRVVDKSLYLSDLLCQWGVHS